MMRCTRVPTSSTDAMRHARVVDELTERDDEWGVVCHDTSTESFTTARLHGIYREAEEGSAHARAEVTRVRGPATPTER
jgi:hypothetical protein